MHRLTARILLVLLLVSVLAPAALAVAGPQQGDCCSQKCCLRMRHLQGQDGPKIQSPSCRQQDCCGWFATS